MKNSKVARAYEAVADQIDETGHWKGFGDPEGKGDRHCVITGLQAIFGNAHEVLAVLGPLYDSLEFPRVGIEGLMNVSLITSWNDRSSADVVTSRLRQVAGNLRQADRELVTA